MKKGKRYSRQLALRIGGLVLENPKDRGLIKFLAERLDVTPQTICNWKNLARMKRRPKIGRPGASAELKAEADVAVRQEMRRQGNPGWRPISKALPWLPVRLVQEYVAKIKAERRKQVADERKAARTSIEVKAREAIWTIDGTQTRRTDTSKQYNQVIKDRGSLAYRAVLSGEPAKAEDITSLLEEMPALPLVIASDNDRIYCGEVTSRWLRENQVVHLKSLPGTPQHNGAMEIAMREIKEAAEENGFIEPENLAKMAKQINEFKPRAVRGYKTSTVLDAELTVAYSKVCRAEFYEKCTARLRKVATSPMEWREKRMAEREIIYATLEEYGLVKRTGGEGSVRRENAKIFL